MIRPSPIVAEFARMALDDDPRDRHLNLSVAAQVMTEEERAAVWRAAEAMLAELGALRWPLMRSQ